jgi:hypothetical protein
MKYSRVLYLGLLIAGILPGNGQRLLAQAAQASTDPALQQPQVIANPPAAYRQEARAWQGIPGIERAPNGRLWAVWYSGGKGEGPGNFLVLETSTDDGATWSSEKFVIAPPAGTDAYLREFDPCLWIDPDHRLWLFWAQDVSHWDGRGGVWAISTSKPGSASPSWSKPKRISDGILLNKPIVLDTGSWLLPIAGWKNLPVKIPQSVVDASHLTLDAVSHGGGPLKGSNIFESTDKLKTIHFLGQAQVPDTWFDEHMAVERLDHSLWMLVRTTYGIGQASSADGKQWTSHGDTGLGHVNSRFFVRRLQSGHLLLVSNMPLTGTSRARMTARISTDDGQTWSSGLLLDERESVAYPDGIQAPDGRIFVIHDHDRQGVGEIMLSIFDESDVLAGKAVSKDAHLHIVISALK